MAAEIGRLALILALVLALVQALPPLWGAARGDGRLMALGRAAALLQLGFVLTAFACLASAYLSLDFSVALVARHSHSTQPAVYRLAATWGSHEGSMLLWVTILALCGGAVAWFGRGLRETLQVRVLAVQGMIGAAFLAFLIFTSNPFTRLDPAPFEGTELNPLLQDPGLVLHPPLLYLGYVGLSVAFAFAIAALIEGRVDAAWARWVRPWVLAAWTALTAGIALGSWWAYYELGWGGWWFWDPVENASLMPWLAGTALLHSALVLERRGALVSWTILLAILAFSLSLIGTFLVRSGVLTSVHAFAVDPERGVYILAIIVLTTGAALGLYAWRAPAMRSGAMFAPLSREGAITLNNLFLLACTATVFLGTFYPVFVDVLRGDKISVGPPYYKIAFMPLAVPLLMLVTFGPMLNWKRHEARELLRRLRWPLGIAAAALVAGVAAFGVKGLLTAAAMALGVWLIAGAGAILARRWKGWRSVRTTPAAVWGLVMAHAGLGVLALGVTGVSTFETSKVLMMSPGQTTELAGRTVRLDSVEAVAGPNYEAMQARFTVDGRRALVSEKRFYPSSQDRTTEAAIGMGLLGATYIAIGDPAPDGALTVRIWDHPLVGWIWGGGLIMALGGLVSLSDRRLRLGARVRAPVRGPELATA